MEGLCETFFRTVGGDCEKALVKVLEGFGEVGLVVIIERMGVKVDLSMAGVGDTKNGEWRMENGEADRPKSKY